MLTQKHPAMRRVILKTIVVNMPRQELALALHPVRRPRHGETFWKLAS